MPTSVACAILANCVAVVSAAIVARRSANWRIKFLAMSMGLLTLCQVVVMLANHRIWLGSPVGQTAESLELLLSALCLSVLHLLNKENRDRVTTDKRLRVAETPGTDSAEPISLRTPPHREPASTSTGPARA